MHTSFPTDVKERKSGRQYTKTNQKRKWLFFVRLVVRQGKGSDHFGQVCVNIPRLCLEYILANDVRTRESRIGRHNSLWKYWFGRSGDESHGAEPDGAGRSAVSG
ncbi:Uncharacterised protein [Vibrio cholerae]|nr:Uncharacterised protein [Vibrio cholerae]